MDLPRANPARHKRIRELQALLFGAVPALWVAILIAGILISARLSGLLSSHLGLRGDPGGVSVARRVSESDWLDDIDVLQREMLRKDLSFSPLARDRFVQALAKVRSGVAREDDVHIVAELSEAVALGGNAHSMLFLDSGPVRLHRFPLRLWRFQEGVFVVAAPRHFSRFLGCRVTAVSGHNIEQVISAAARLFPGNQAHRDLFAVRYVTTPELLRALDILSAQEARWSFDCLGKEMSSELPSESTQARYWPTWHDLSPRSHSSDDMEFVAREPLPLYLQHPESSYWFQEVPEQNLLYAQFNRAMDQDGGETILQWSQRVIEAMKKSPAAALVLDLRFNPGGDLTRGRKAMLAMQEACEHRRVFVITGPSTFSAGLYHAAQWKQWGKAVFVGDPPGDELDFWAEGGDLVLPHSGIWVRYSDGFHGYSGKDYPERRPYYMELKIGSLQPDLPVPMMFQDFKEGRDGAMDAIVKELHAGRANPHTAPR